MSSVWGNKGNLLNTLQPFLSHCHNPRQLDQQLNYLLHSKDKSSLRGHDQSGCLQYITFHHIADPHFAIPDAANNLVSEVLLQTRVSPTFPLADVCQCLNPHPPVFLLHTEMETLSNHSFSFFSFLLFCLKYIQGGNRRRNGKGRVRSRLPKQFPFPYRAQLISFQSNVPGKLHISSQHWLSWNLLSQSTATR